MEAKLKKRLLALTWDELREWSDARSVERGRGYLSRVEPPVLFPDGGLVAEVHGSDTYYAKLRVDASGRLEGVCTCPVGFRCKPGVVQYCKDRWPCPGSEADDRNVSVETPHGGAWRSCRA